MIEPVRKVLSGLPALSPVDARRLLDEARAGFRHKIVVLDDDPTGVQTVHGVYVYTDWGQDTLRAAFQAPEQMFYILTNSRSLTEQATIQLHEAIADNLAQVSEDLRMPFLLLSRGDSTLRGHYPLETEVLRSSLEKRLGQRFDFEVICPFFYEGGRYTIDDIHYATQGERLRPVGETEFARDQTFAYQSSNLCDYVAEKTKGRYRRADCLSISLTQLRTQPVEQIAQRLLGLKGFQKVIVNAVEYTDLMVFAAAWMLAMGQGAHAMARCGASLPKVLGGISDIPLLDAGRLAEAGSGKGGLVIVGSHVKRSTEQLQALLEAGLPHAAIEFSVDHAQQAGALSREAQRVGQAVEAALLAGETAIVYTSRDLLAPQHLSSQEKLSLSVAISQAIAGMVSALRVRPAFVIAKGGITSSDIGTKGLGVKKALVLGQVAAGVPVWHTGDESKFPGLNYVIFPGNVGTEAALKELVRALVGALPPSQ